MFNKLLSNSTVKFLLWSCNYGSMLGLILQTVGERMAFIPLLMLDIILRFTLLPFVRMLTICL